MFPIIFLEVLARKLVIASFQLDVDVRSPQVWLPSTLLKEELFSGRRLRPDEAALEQLVGVLLRAGDVLLLPPEPLLLLALLLPPRLLLESLPLQPPLLFLHPQGLLPLPDLQARGLPVPEDLLADLVAVAVQEGELALNVVQGEVL